MNELDKKKIRVAIDNVLGLSYLNSFVDVAIQTPELREEIHIFINKIIYDMGQFEIIDEDIEYMKDFV